MALVVVCFCVPLFVELGGHDLRNDEAIYSYSVQRILETGNWLTPRAIPFDGPFLEKPPLKLWMVAAPIALGLLPADEVGLRAVDALLGAFAFLYVFLLGRWLSGLVCGSAAVLVLFTFDPLIFDHGLRSNNMEALLFLCHVAGVYHGARWIDGGGTDAVTLHRWPVALAFAFGFMAKFVAILFLPLILMGAVLARRDGMRLVRSSWRAWIGPAALAAAMIAPWFVYQTFVTGRHVWMVMFGEHVYRRFTGALDVHHLLPWNYYIATIWRHLDAAGSGWIVIAGGAALLLAACRRDGWLARVCLFWAVMPVALVSLGSSKVFHYIYPFLPPLALGAGYAASLAYTAAAGGLEGAIAPFRRRFPAPVHSPRPAVRAVAWVLVAAAGLAVLTALLTAVRGDRLSLEIAGAEVFENSSVLRPFVIGALLLFVAGRIRWAARLLAVPILLMILPVEVYRATLERIASIDRPLRTARDCMLPVRASAGGVHTVYNAVPSLTYHSYNYYFQAFERWVRVDRPDPDELHARLAVPTRQTPVLLSEADYVEFAMPMSDDGANPGSDPPLLGFSVDQGIVVLLPGQYASCAAPAVAAGARPIGFLTRGGSAR